MDSDDADEANKNDDGRTLLYVFERGWLFYLTHWISPLSSNCPKQFWLNCAPSFRKRRSASRIGVHQFTAKVFTFHQSYLDMKVVYVRDSIGDSAISGDLRWAGSFGVNVDFVARSHCSVEIILVEDMQVWIQKYPQTWNSAAVITFIRTYRLTYQLTIPVLMLTVKTAEYPRKVWILSYQVPSAAGSWDIQKHLGAKKGFTWNPD